MKPKPDDAEGSDPVDCSGKAPSTSASYVAHVTLDHDRLMVDGHEQAIAPGMTVTAEIKTGKRTVIGYLLSPLSQSISEAGVER